MTELVQIKTNGQQTNTRTRKRKVMLLFPPEWVPTAPYLALPSLTAVLREAGHQVVQKDINIEMYDHFFSDSFLIWAKARQGMQLELPLIEQMRQRIPANVPIVLLDGGAKLAVVRTKEEDDAR